MFRLVVGAGLKWSEMIEKKSFFLSLFRHFYSTIHTLGALFTIKRPQKSQIRLEIQIFYYKNASNEVVEKSNKNSIIIVKKRRHAS